MPLSPQDYLMNVPSPAQGVMGGVMQGLSLANIMEQREFGKQRAAREEQLFGQQMAASEQAMRVQRQTMALKAREAEQQRQAALVLRTDLSNLATMKTPTAKDYNSLLLKHPQMADTLKQSYEMMGSVEKKRITNDSIQIYSALENNRPDLAKNILTEKLTAAENAGLDKQVATLKSTLATLEASPEAAKTTAGLMLSSSLGADKFADQFQKLKATARAEQTIGLEQLIKYEEMNIKREDTKLKTLEAKHKREQNELKREELELKIEDQKMKLGEAEEGKEIKRQERISEAKGAIESLDRTISTIEDIQEHPGLDAATGMSSFMAMIPGTDARDVSALIETLSSQTFVAEVQKMRGLGALSESEGRKLSAAVANLDLGQSTKAFKKNLKIALGIFEAGREKTLKLFKDVDLEAPIVQLPTAPPPGAVRRLP